MKITVVGPGRWGSLITWYLDRKGHDIKLYGIYDCPEMIRYRKERKNDYLEMPESVKLTSDLDDLVDAEVIVISINSQNLRGFMEEIKPYNFKDKIFVLCMKGIDIDTGKRLSQIAEEALAPANKVAVWIGPGHVQEFYRGVPNCMVIDSNDSEVKEFLVNEFTSDLIRFYYGEDLIGNEIGAAAKNVIGIAAGMLDALGLSSLKGALMSRGTREVARLIKAMGGNELSAYGLCHLGDYEATVFSQFSHNRMFGECFAKKEPFSSLAEGYYTVVAMMKLGKDLNVELPICEAVYKVLYEEADVKKTLDGLFRRDIKSEFN